MLPAAYQSPADLKSWRAEICIEEGNGNWKRLFQKERVLHFREQINSLKVADDNETVKLAKRTDVLVKIFNVGKIPLFLFLQQDGLTELVEAGI